MNYKRDLTFLKKRTPVVWLYFNMIIQGGVNQKNEIRPKNESNKIFSTF